MKLSHLIANRDALRRQAHLANMAFAYQSLSVLASRIGRANLRGLVCLQSRDPSADRHWPVLTALEGSQSVIEEHFTDEHIADLADLLSFYTGRDDVSVRFRLEELTDTFLDPLRSELLRAGVQWEDAAPSEAALKPGDPSRGGR